MQPNTKLIFTIFIIVSVAIIGYFIYSPHTTQQELPSTFALSPQPTSHPTPTVVQEPIVNSWTTYTNNDYNFTISIPENWSQQEYKLSNGGFIVAFSPTNDLPCANCSYVHEGYFSIHIFSQKTDPQAYTTFVQSLASIGKVQGYQGAQIDNVKGVLYGNVAEVQNHGWVYQLVLDENNGNDNLMNSQIFLHAASSMQFTYLLFNQ